MSLAASLNNLRDVIMNKINSLRNQISRLNDTLDARNATIEDMKNMRDPFETPSVSNYEDALGYVTITSGNGVAESPDKIWTGQYIRVKSGYDSRTPNYAPLCIPRSFSVFRQGGWCLDMSQAQRVSFMNFLYTDTKEGVIADSLKRLLLSEKFSYNDYTLDGVSNMIGGLYLSKSVSGTNTANWIRDTTTSTIHVKCPVDSDVNYYLNKFSISAEDMVAIFENMIDRSAQTSTKYITLGSANLAKLTSEQKNIALAKGWDLQ